MHIKKNFIIAAPPNVNVTWHAREEFFSSECCNEDRESRHKSYKSYLSCTRISPMCMTCELKHKQEARKIDILPHSNVPLELKMDELHRQLFTISRGREWKAIINSARNNDFMNKWIFIDKKKLGDSRAFFITEKNWFLVKSHRALMDFKWQKFSLRTKQKICV